MCLTYLTVDMHSFKEFSTSSILGVALTFSVGLIGSVLEVVVLNLAYLNKAGSPLVILLGAYIILKTIKFILLYRVNF